MSAPNYLGDIGRTGALTISDIAAYNAPYFTIVAATHDPRPLLLFDFVLQDVTGTVGAGSRARGDDAARSDAAFSRGGEMASFRAQLRRCLALSVGTALGAGPVPCFAAGPVVSSVMFDKRSFSIMLNLRSFLPCWSASR